MQHRIGMAIICLHISAALYLLIGGLLFLVLDVRVLEIDNSRSGHIFMSILAAVCVGIVLGIEVVAWGLRRRKFWAWVAGLVIFGIYVPSLFFLLGGFGLWGLLDPGSRREFGVGVRPTGFDPIIPEAKQL